MLAARLLLALVALLLAVVVPSARAQDVIQIGGQTGAQIFFDSSRTRTFNFGVTTTGGESGLSLSNVLVYIKRDGSVSDPVVATVYDNFGGTGNVIATGSLAATNFSTSQFNGAYIPLNTNVSLGAGAFSIVLTSATSGGAQYFYKQSKLTLQTTNGTVLSSTLWTQDSNDDGTAGTNMQTTTPILADYMVSTTNVNFGNYRVGSAVTTNVALTNTAFFTTNNLTESLVTATSATNAATVAGLSTNFLAATNATNFNVGLSTVNVGTNSGTVTLNYTSVTNGSASTRGAATNIGSQSIAVTGVGFRLADDAVSTTNLNLGRFHIGYTTNNGSLSGTVGITNTATGDGFSEGLAVANDGTSGGATVGALPAGLVAAGASTNFTLGLGSVSAVGTNSGSVTLGFQSSGTGTSGFAATNIGTQVVNVIAQGYSGQAFWNTDAGGSWNNFDNWDVPGGTPGIDGVLSTNDTASFGNAISSARTVSLNGQSPVLTSLSFSNASASYTVAQGSGGDITMGTASAAQTVVTNSAGSHTVSAAISLARATQVGVATNSKLSVAAVNGSQNLNKSGTGTLSITGSGNLSGTTTVTGGTLNVNGSISNSTVTMSTGTVLSGSGSVGATTIANGATISPGNSPGNITITGDLDWSPGGNYDWQIYNAAGPAGTGWDLITITGILDLSALSAGNEFNINMWSLASLSPDANGDAINFDNTQSYRWTIATAAGGITNFSATYFNLFETANNGAGGFSNDLGGGLFTLETQGNNLDIVFNPGSGPGPQPVPEPGTWAAAALLLGGAAYVRWRKRGQAAA